MNVLQFEFMRETLKISFSSVEDRAYKALIRPVLEYARFVWDPNSIKRVICLELIPQKAAQ